MHYIELLFDKILLIISSLTPLYVIYFTGVVNTIYVQRDVTKEVETRDDTVVNNVAT